MKPIGTITSCFPHIDDETKRILQSVMEEAKDYNDFSEKLVEKVLSENVPDLAIYFAYFHVYNQGKYDFLRKLIDAGVETELTKLFPLISAARAGEKIEWNQYQKSMFDALKRVENDWMACRVYIAWRGMVDEWYPESVVDIESLNILSSKIINDDEYGFFRSDLHRITARRLRAEDSIKECISYYDKAISEAKIHDDKEALVILYLEKANQIKRFNFNEALSILEVAKELSDELGYLDGETLYTHELGHIAMAKGEFEKAISYQERVIAGRKERNLPVGFMKFVVALLYNQKGDGKTALEFIRDGKDDIVGSDAFYQTQETWANILLNRLHEANEGLERARELALKSGEESFLGYIHFLEGLMEKEKGDLTTAVFSFKNAMEIFSKVNSLTYMNFTFIELVDSEIEFVASKKDSERLEVSGPWMRKLHNHVAERDLPGTEAQAKLLLAKFRFKQGRIQESRALVDEVMKIADTSGMLYLKKKAELLIPDLILS